MQRDYLRSCLNDIEIICPLLHHGLTLGQVFGAVVGSSYFVAFTVGKLTFDHVRVEAGFVEDGGGYCPEAVTSHFALVTQTVKGKKHGVVADRVITVSAWEYVTASAGNCLEFGQYG